MNQIGNGDVYIEQSFKANMGNYESLGVTTGLRLPIQDGESPQEAIQRVSKIVAENLEEKLAAVKEMQRQGKRS